MLAGNRIFLQDSRFFHNFGEPPIRRPNKAPPAAAKDGPRINDDIRNAQIQLIDQTGDNKGTVETVLAIRMAQEAGMDLVEISPNVSPPVCKIMDYGKYKYSAQKKAAEARKRQKTVEIKEIKLRPKTDDHDIAFKTKAARKFLEAGHKVKFTVRFRGREITHPEKAQEQLQIIIPQLEDIANVATRAMMEARAMSVLVAPKPAVMQKVAQMKAQREKERQQAEKEGRALPSEESLPEIEDEDEDDNDD